jgi:hypothetical protein
MRRDVRRWTPATVDERYSRLGNIAETARGFLKIFHAGLAAGFGVGALSRG